MLYYNKNMKKGIDEYNYLHFDPKDYNFTKFPGPKPGTKYIDFEATTLEGKRVKLSDYLDKPVILETGSITCPIYANASKHMLKLAKTYPDFHFLVLYIREAHPGSKTPAQQTMKDKLENAKKMRAQLSAGHKSGGQKIHIGYGMFVTRSDKSHNWKVNSKYRNSTMKHALFLLMI